MQGFFNLDEDGSVVDLNSRFTGSHLEGNFSFLLAKFGCFAYLCNRKHKA